MTWVVEGRGEGIPPSSVDLQQPRVSEGLQPKSMVSGGSSWQGVLIAAPPLSETCFLSFGPPDLLNSQESCKDHLFSRDFRDEWSREEKVA